MAKYGSTKQYVLKEVLTSSDHNGVNNELGGNPIIGHNANTGAREDFDIGDPTSGATGHILNNARVRSGEKLQIYDATGALITEITWDALGSGGAGGGLEAISLKIAMEKQNKWDYPLPNQYYISNSFADYNTGHNEILVWLRQIYDASVDLTTMYLDHGTQYELTLVNDMETVGDFTSGTATPTVAADAVNFIEGTQSVKFTATNLNGSANMYDTVSMGFNSKHFRISVRPDTLSNVDYVYVQLYTSAGNYRTFQFPVAQLTAAVWNHLTCDLDDSSAYTDTGTFARGAVTRIYFGIHTTSAQTVVPSWDLARTISSQPLLVPSYSLSLPIQDATNQEFVHINSEDRTDNTTKGTFTINAALTYDYPAGLSKNDLDTVYLSSQTGTVADNKQVHKSTASGQNAKTAKTTETIYLNQTKDSCTLEAFLRYYDEAFTVTDFPSTSTIKVYSDTDKSTRFLDDDYVFLFKKLRTGYKDRSMEGSYTLNYKYLQLNANATYASSEITLSHDGSNAVGADDTGYFIVRASAFLDYIAGNKTNNTIVRVTPSEFIPYGNSIPYFTGATEHWNFMQSSGQILGVKAGSHLNRRGAWSNKDGYFPNGYATGFDSNSDGIGGDLAYAALNTSPYVKYSCEMVMKIDSNPSRMQFYCNSDAADNFNTYSAMAIIEPSNIIYMGVKGANIAMGASIAGLFGDNRFHYFVFTFDSSAATKMSVYIDGSLYASSGVSYGITDSDGYMQFACSMYGTQSDYWLRGALADATWWTNTVMTSDQISQRWNNGDIRPYSNSANDCGYLIKCKIENLADVDKLVLIGTNDRAITTVDTEVMSLGGLVY